MRTPTTEVINFTRGVPANESFPTAEIAEAAQAALREHGLRAHAGPLASVERVLGPAGRRALAGEGVLAVDLESAWLAGGAAAGRRLAVVRAVADPDGRRLADPRMLLEGARALLALRSAVPVLAEWADAIEVPSPHVPVELLVS